MLHPKQIHYTGEGFKGEKILTIFATGLMIISTVLLIRLTLLQHTHLEEERAEKAKAVKP